MKICVENCSGNWFDAACFVNGLGMAEYVVGFHLSGYNTQILFRVPDELAYSPTSAASGYYRLRIPTRSIDTN